MEEMEFDPKLERKKEFGLAKRKGDLLAGEKQM